MAKLSADVKASIVQALACYETPSRVVELVKKEFGLNVTRQQVSAYDPSKAMAKSLSQKWTRLFDETRERFQRETAEIAISHKAYRLRVLDRMAANAESMKNYGMTAQLLEQAAKEMGGTYTNKVKVENTGKDGGPLQTQVTKLPPEQALQAYKDFIG